MAPLTFRTRPTLLAFTTACGCTQNWATCHPTPSSVNRHQKNLSNRPKLLDHHKQSFGQFGSVTSAKVMMERDTGRSKSFGFVEMGSDADAQAAIEGMNGQPLGGRSVVVNEARPMEARPPRTGGGGCGGY